jgi:hypothetical protein
MGIAEKRPQGVEMDNPGTESTELNMDSAAAAFGDLLSPPEPEKVDGEPVEAVEPEAVEAGAEAEDDPLVTIKVDGKDVEVKLSELKNGYQRQADYTRKTMEVAEQRKAAEAEASKAQQERQQYATNLQRMQAQLEVAMQEQQTIDWQQLINTDPQEYMRQRHLFEQRQAALQQNYAEQQHLAQVNQAEQAKQHQSYLSEQREQLLAKLPEWKDEAKAKAETAQIREYLMNQGFDAQTVDSVADAKMVITARKAMLFDQMVAKAQATTKKVSALPTKVEKPGTGANPSLDRRTSDFQRLSKSGTVEDAARVFDAFL